MIYCRKGRKVQECCTSECCLAWWEKPCKENQCCKYLVLNDHFLKYIQYKSSFEKQVCWLYKVNGYPNKMLMCQFIDSGPTVL